MAEVVTVLVTTEAATALVTTDAATLAMAALAVVLAAVLDTAVAEPPVAVHPVAWFGRLVARFDRDWSHPRLVGVAVAVVLPLGAAGGVGLAVWLAGRLHPVAVVVVAGLALFVGTSRRMLLDAARDVVALSETDPGRARAELSALAGRDADALSPALVRSAAVESAAENLADGLVAPLLAFAVLAPVSIAVAAGAAGWVKAVNTLDSMLGYEHKPVGTASARLDDAVMWGPARLSAFLLAVAAGTPRAARVPRPWLAAVPSPNSGWPMGTLAAATGTRLEKPGVYVLNPDATLPSPDRAERGVRVVARASALAFVLTAGSLAALAAIGYVSADRSVPPAAIRSVTSSAVPATLPGVVAWC